MRRTIARLALAAVMAVSGGAPALPGEQYVDPGGFAVSGFDSVAFFDAAQAPVGEAQPAPTPGRADITAEWNGAVWAFATEENRVRFLANPTAYAPAYDGHCAYGVAKGAKVPGDPQQWRIVDGRLYLNLDESVQETWLEDIRVHIAEAEANWAGLEPGPASDDPPPELEPGSAPVAD